jgi:hypothetical protein
MGLFSDDKPPPREPTPPPPLHKGFLHEAGILLLGAGIGLIAWGGKGAFSFFSKHTPDKVKILLVFIIPVVLYSTIPQLRDMVTLANGVTVNVSDKIVAFPPKEEFYRRDSYRFDYDGKTYIAYSIPYRSMVKKDECYLVPRGEHLLVKTTIRPVYAVGFEEKPIITQTIRIKDLPTGTYVYEYLSSPAHLFMLLGFQKEIVDNTIKEQEFYITWDNLMKDWGRQEVTFFISAKWNQHALLCF